MPVGPAAAGFSMGGPVGTAAAVVGTRLLGSFFGGRSKKKQIKYANQQNAQMAAKSRELFDQRLNWQNEGDRVQYANEDAGAAAMDALDREGFNRTLAEQGRGFDTQLGLSRDQIAEALGLSGGMRDEAGALNDDRLAKNAEIDDRLFTTLRDVREGNLALSKEELDRQRAFQAQADAVTAAFLGSVGQPGFDADRVAAEVRRNATTAGAVTGARSDVPLTRSGHSFIKDYYARRSTDSVREALDEATAGNKVAAYGDAAYEAGANVRNTGQKLSMLDEKATLSAGALTQELSAKSMLASNAADSAAAEKNRNAALSDAFNSALSDFYSARGGASSDFYAGKKDAAQTFNDTSVNSLADLFNGRMDATGRYYDRVGAGEASYTDDKVKANAGYEDALKSATAQRVQGYQPSSTLASGFNALSAAFSSGLFRRGTPAGSMNHKPTGFTGRTVGVGAQAH